MPGNITPQFQKILISGPKCQVAPAQCEECAMMCDALAKTIHCYRDKMHLETLTLGYIRSE